MIGGLLPWLLLLAALGSQTSAIIGATSSRSDMLVNHQVPRTTTFPIILVPAIVLVILVDVNVAVDLASRVFAAYFTVQASLAILLAARKKNWWAGDRLRRRCRGDARRRDLRSAPLNRHQRRCAADGAR